MPFDCSRVIRSDGENGFVADELDAQDKSSLRILNQLDVIFCREIACHDLTFCALRKLSPPTDGQVITICEALIDGLFLLRFNPILQP